MSEDRTPNANPEQRKASPGQGKAPTEQGKAPQADAQRNARELFKGLDGSVVSDPVDERFKQSLEGLSRRLSEQAASQTPKDPRIAAEARRAALAAYDLARARRLQGVLKTGGAAALAAGIAWLVVFISASPEPPSRATASRERPAAVEAAAVAPARAAAAPTPIAPAPPVPAPSVTAPASVTLASVDPTTVASTPPAPEPASLQRDEVREVQTRLRSFGFNPGALDGATGPMTQGAIMRYQQDRGLQQTGVVDRDLLEQLRQDPAPQVVAPQVAQRPARPARTSNGSRQSDAFEPMRAAARDIERWFQSLGR